MSTCNVQASHSAAASAEYALYGRGEKNSRHKTMGTNRAAAMACTLESPEVFVQRAEALATAHSRKVEVYSYTQNFSPDEFDAKDHAHAQRVNELGVRLAERMHSADHLVVTHADSLGGHLHNHIYVVNHDNLTGKSLQRFTSWKNGLHQLNDELMREEGCRVLESPERAKPEWELRREEYAHGGFEQTLGDSIQDVLMDERCVDRESFERLLGENGVRMARTERDGISYKMRREDNGKIGRKKASRLADEFTAEGLDKIFEARRVAQQQIVTQQQQQALAQHHTQDNRLNKDNTKEQDHGDRRSDRAELEARAGVGQYADHAGAALPELEPAGGRRRRAAEVERRGEGIAREADRHVQRPELEERNVERDSAELVRGSGDGGSEVGDLVAELREQRERNRAREVEQERQRVERAASRAEQAAARDRRAQQRREAARRDSERDRGAEARERDDDLSL